MLCLLNISKLAASLEEDLLGFACIRTVNLSLAPSNCSGLVKDGGVSVQL